MKVALVRCKCINKRQRDSHLHKPASKNIALDRQVCEVFK